MGKARCFADYLSVLRLGASVWACLSGLWEEIQQAPCHRRSCPCPSAPVPLAPIHSPLTLSLCPFTSSPLSSNPHPLISLPLIPSLSSPHPQPLVPSPLIPSLLPPLLSPHPFPSSHSEHPPLHSPFACQDSSRRVSFFFKQTAQAVRGGEHTQCQMYQVEVVPSCSQGTIWNARN